VDIQLIKSSKKKISQLYRLINKEDRNLGKKILKIKYSKKFLKEISPLVFKILKILKNSYKFNNKRIAKSYVEFCRETLMEQFYFKKNPTYRAIKQNINNLNFYNSKEKMKAYIIGLLLTQIFWVHHIKILNWYFSNLSKKNKINNYLEIGAGHGLLSVLLQKQKSVEGVIIDVSQGAINSLKKVFKQINVERRISFKKINFLKFKNEKNFDFIIMGEVIEHVKNPVKFLRKSKSLLSNSGSIFLTTCANCAQHDHLFHFKDVKHIKKIIKKAGLTVSKEYVVPSENIPKNKWVKEKIAISYCAFVKNAKR
tara:strand:- start:460 stop:1392 length:933 start_codon:yes stop_codon:yes gene_type:complete